MYSLTNIFCLTRSSESGEKQGTTDSINNKGDSDDDNDDGKHAVRDDNKAAMPPKEVRPKATMKKPTATTETTLPTLRLPLNFSVDSTDKFGIAYYCGGTQDLADVVIHVNGVLDVSNYCMSSAQDGMSVSWQHSIKSVCCIKEILAAIMENAYSPSNHCIIIYNNVAQEMFAKKIDPTTSLFGEHRR
jgi:hypothetical protein